MTWAMARFGNQCLGTGYKLAYGLKMPKDPDPKELKDLPLWEKGVALPVMTFLMGFRMGHRELPAASLNILTGEPTLNTGRVCMLSDLSAVSRISRASYRASRMPYLWPHAKGLCTVGIHTDHKLKTSTLLFGCQSEKPDDRSLARFCGMESMSVLGENITSRWIPIFNFRVPSVWVELSVIEVLRGEELCVWGIRRWGCREIWFPGTGWKEKDGSENYVEQFGPDDEIMLPLWSGSAFMKKYYSHLLPNAELSHISHDTLSQQHISFRWEW